ncbi:MAG TPA: tetratricopeptide repeat protein [Flavisolibacter sp.]
MKISTLGELAEYYYAYRLEKKADSIHQMQLLVAHLSNNKELVLSALFDNSITHIGSWTSKETFDRILAFLQKGLDYSREIGRSDYEALAYVKKATILRKRGLLDDALQHATMAYSTLSMHQIDSLKAFIHLELGDIFLAKGEAVSAFKNYNNAFDIAYDMKNARLQSQIYRHYAALYQSLDNIQLAETYLFKSMTLNRETNNANGLLMDYIELAKLTDQKVYIDNAIFLADSLKLERYKLSTKRLLFAYYMAVEKNSEAALNYLNKNKDLRQSYLNTGMSNYYWNMGSVFLHSNKPDSAIRYLQMAEPGLQKSFDASSQRMMYKEMALCYTLINQTDKAIEYFEKAQQLGTSLKDLKTDTLIMRNLSELYAQAGAYKKAFEFGRQYDFYKNELQRLADQRQVVLLEVDREKRKHEKDLQDLAKIKLRKKNLQYMGISIFLVGFFITLILIGMFPLSKFTIRLLSFFSLICLFEFIVLLLESYMHRITHGEPLKVWISKIFLIAALVPLQHYLEHALIRYMQSQKLIKLRSQLSVKRWWSKMRRPPPTEAAVEKEETTLTL